jgi:hypothetical protein
MIFTALNVLGFIFAGFVAGFIIGIRFSMWLDKRKPKEIIEIDIPKVKPKRIRKKKVPTTQEIFDEVINEENERKEMAKIINRAEETKQTLLP